MNPVFHFFTFITASMLLPIYNLVKSVNVKNEWGAIDNTADPTESLLAEFWRAKPHSVAGFVPTDLTRIDYMRLISSEIDFWKTHQNEDGAIIDPYSHDEFQYSTPAFAHAAAALVVWDQRDDLLKPAVKALDWSVNCLRKRKAANKHEDFYPGMIAHTMLLLKSCVSIEHFKQWERGMKSYIPWKVYRKKPGAKNWNVVSSCGEELLRQMGIRKGDAYIETSFAAQGRYFTSQFGLYCEGPMAYDLFPRLFLEGVLSSGYRGKFRSHLETMLNRAAITSLFMQSPWGELPAGGRSAQHQWNEAQEVAIFELYARKAFHNDDIQLAGAYKRAAHLALKSMLRWVRPSGELQIVKNWMDPGERFAYERYSSHTQYNLLPMSMLALAYEYAESTEKISEYPAPADIGGFVFELPELHKVFANAGGGYVEIEERGDQHYDATGLIRIHFPGLSPQLGPSDSICAKPSYNLPLTCCSVNTGVGVAWVDAEGVWHRIGELDDEHISKTSLSVITQSQKKVEFSMLYEGDFYGISQIKERYIVTREGVDLITELPEYHGPLQYIWPVLVDDGRSKSQISVVGKTLFVSQDGGKTAETFTASEADSISVAKELYANHNGFVRLAQAEFSKGGSISLKIAPFYKAL